MAPGPFALDWLHPLPAYQRHGIERLLARRGLLGSALVVTPAGLVLQWRAQLRDWAPELRLSTVRGTPLENRLDDLVSLLDFVVPGRFDRRQMMVGLRRLLEATQLDTSNNRSLIGKRV